MVKATHGTRIIVDAAALALLMGCAWTNVVAPARVPAGKLPLGRLLYSSGGKLPSVYVMSAGGIEPILVAPSGHAYWSPDGSRFLAWTNIVHLDAQGQPQPPWDATDRIELANADGSGRRTLPRGTEPAWSPDGAHIAFVDYTEYGAGGDDIYAMNVDEGSPYRLTSGPNWEFSPMWSPDGKRIAFKSVKLSPDHDIQKDVTDISVMDADGSGLTRLARFTGYTSGPVWSPDGASIVFVAPGRELQTIQADGTGPRNLAMNAAASYEPAWSPDGRRIAFTCFGPQPYEDEICVVDADGQNLRRLTSNLPGNQLTPIWSPDGEWIAFWVPSQPYNDIFVIKNDGSAPANLTGDIPGAQNPFGWAP